MKFIKEDMEFNKKELALIEKINDVFPKVELDPNVAIGICWTPGEKGIEMLNKLFAAQGKEKRLEVPTNQRFSYSSYERKLEAFFRDVSCFTLTRLQEEDDSVFFPARYNPVPWWKVNMETFRHVMDFVFYGLSPYGLYYYLPAFMLATLHDLNLQRRKMDLTQRLIGIGLLNELAIRGRGIHKKTGNDFWKEAGEVESRYRDPLFKGLSDLRTCENPSLDIVFLSLLSEEQKKLLAQFVMYTVDIAFPYSEDEEKYENTHRKTLFDVWGCVEV